MKRKRREKIDLKRRLGSIAFFLAIPTTFFLAGIAFIELMLSLQEQGFVTSSWGPFLCGVVGALGVLFFLKLSWLRVFVHEAKHGIVVLLSGNRLDDMVVKEDSGHVSYSVYETRTQFEPFIMLAPYFFPLLSLPVFVACLFLESDYRVSLAFLLGLSLATDLKMAWFELYPNQSDLQRIRGGFLFAASFIGGTNMLWALCCLLWIQEGRAGYGNALLLTLQAIHSAIF